MDRFLRIGLPVTIYQLEPDTAESIVVTGLFIIFKSSFRRTLVLALIGTSTIRVGLILFVKTSMIYCENR